MTEDKEFETDLSVKIGKMELKNPVIACSGTFASGLEYSKFYDVSKLGAITTKSFSLEKRTGNEPPRLFETPAGLLNSVGLENEGIDYFINTQIDEVKKLKVNIILSIFGQDIEEFIKIAEKIKKIEKEIFALELNFSCPNIKKGGMSFCLYPDQVKSIAGELNRKLDLPIIVKLSPNFHNINETALAAKEGGAEAVSIINTIAAAAFDIETFKPRIKNIVAGLSGPAVRPVAVLKVFEMARANILPVIGMGGIAACEDALEFIIAGASAVGVGTANFIDPLACEKIISGITEYLKKKRIKNIKEITGAALNFLK